MPEPRASEWPPDDSYAGTDPDDIAAGIEHGLEIQAGGGGDRALERAFHRTILIARLDGDRRQLRLR